MNTQEQPYCLLSCISEIFVRLHFFSTSSSFGQLPLAESAVSSVPSTSLGLVLGVDKCSTRSNETNMNPHLEEGEHSIVYSNALGGRGLVCCSRDGRFPCSARTSNTTHLNIYIQAAYHSTRSWRPLHNPCNPRISASKDVVSRKKRRCRRLNAPLRVPWKRQWTLLNLAKVRALAEAHEIGALLAPAASF